MKDSGVEWLGEIPAHWKVTVLGRVVAAGSGGTPPMGVAEYWNGNVPWVSPKDMKATRLSDSKVKITDAALETGRVGIAKANDLLIVVRSGILRHSIPTAIAERELTYNQDLKGLTPTSPRIHIPFLQRLIMGNQFELLERWRKHVATVESIEVPWMLATSIPLPPIDEQRAICEHLDHMDELFSLQRSRFEREIELMQEYRTRLISDVVTGKVRVS